LARDIGVSGPVDDDTSPHLSDHRALQPPLDVDSNGEALLRSYAAARVTLNARGFKLGRPPLAILSKALGERRPNPYHDMDFWSDHRESVYRPQFTVRALSEASNFRYVDHTLLERFSEPAPGRVAVQGRNIDTGGPVTLTCRRLVLATGAINTARVTLRSLDQHRTRVPLLCNPYTYVPVLNLPMLGRPARDRRHSMAQLTGRLIPHERPEEQVVATCYSYRSLLLFKLAQEMPLLPSLELLMTRLIHLLTGASIHYAGTLPFADDEAPLTCAVDGRIRPTVGVYATDSAPWQFLPAKGLTFTLMANARRVADAVIDSLEREK
jgi:hypothetical protein